MIKKNLKNGNFKNSWRRSLTGSISKITGFGLLLCIDRSPAPCGDVNASKNILAAGLAVSVCRATIRPEQSKSVKAGAEPRKGKKQKPKS